MAVQTPPRTTPQRSEDVEAGVIEDARKRQRRHRGTVAALVAAALVAAGLIVGFAGGGGGSGSGGAGGRDLGGEGAPASHQTLSAPSPAVLASVVRHCDRPRPVWNGIKRPFAAGPAVDAQSGGYVALVSKAPRAGLLCMTGVPGSPYAPDGGSYAPWLVAPGSDQLTLAGGGWFGSSAGTVYDDYGRAGQQVTAVEFIFRNRPAIKAVLHNGWYLAIWAAPSNMPAKRRTLQGAFAAQPSSVLVTTRSGSITSPLPPRCRSHATCGVFDTHHPAATQPHPD